MYFSCHAHSGMPAIRVSGIKSVGLLFTLLTRSSRTYIGMYISSSPRFFCIKPSYWGIVGPFENYFCPDRSPPPICKAER